MSQNNAKKQPLQAVHFGQLQFYQGDVPHPEILDGLGKVNPTFPERVFAIAEEASKERVRASQASTENARMLVESENKFKSRGQMLTFTLFVLILGVTVFLAIIGMTGPAIAACLGGFATLGVSAINGINGRK